MKTMRYCLAACLFASSAAFAADYKVAVVDVERIMRESGPAVRATKKLEKEFEARRAEMQRIATQGKALETILSRNNISETERKAKERELVKLNQDYQRLQREFNEDRNTRMNEEIAAIQERARSAIKRIAETEKYDLILTEQEVLFRSRRLDITEKIIKQLDEK
ncbi:periplasmic chaperone for outer membrane proteins Skp [Formivibrio citricus]|uniref:Periplasmic chaperone for outer membrane proteins Skp n=1 Tax=Formivibrio citricus TaxID=83765 RepID=A0A1I4X8S6_9NEIS|nr:OmpH family outer membrane protein [Formivibrio citricus]SFN22351.1 periplasmic chaperone for outer membrane proteins Skp [Formivibrio citricus]